MCVSEVKKNNKKGGVSMSRGLDDGKIGYSERNDHTIVISQHRPRGTGDDSIMFESLFSFMLAS